MAGAPSPQIGLMLKELTKIILSAGERVAVFIDGSNLFHACKSVGDFKIDLVKLVRELVGERRLVRPYFYTAFNPSKEEQVRFLHALERQGFLVKAIPLKRRGDRFIEKGVDVALVTDVVALAFRDAYDTAILVSGDYDFIEAIRIVMSLGKKVEVAMFSQATNPELKRAADKFVPLEELKDLIRKT